MHKLFKKFGSLALVICTVVTLAALPVSAQEYRVTFIPDTQKVDANGNTFTPGLSVKGEDAIFEYVKTSGAIRTFNSTLSLYEVYALSRCNVGYDDEVHSSDQIGFLEYVGIMNVHSTYFLNRNVYIYDKKDKVYKYYDEAQRIENPDQKELYSAGARVMLSHSMFVQPDNYNYRFPSTALGTFDWSKIVSLNEILAS